LALHPGRNQITKAGKILRLPDAGPLKGRDFVCPLMDDNRARAHVTAKRAGCVARHDERQATASSSGVLQGNVFLSKSTAADTLAHMQDAGLRASTLEATNKRCHDLAVIHRASGMTPGGAAVAAARGIRLNDSFSGSGASSAVAPTENLTAHEMVAASRKAKRAKMMADLRGVVGFGAQEGGPEPTAVADNCSMAAWSEGQRAWFSKPLRLVPAAVRTYMTPRRVAEQCLSALFVHLTLPLFHSFLLRSSRVLLKTALLILR